MSDLVEMIWVEVLGYLEYMFFKLVNRISFNDVSKVEGIFFLVKVVLKNGEIVE